MQVASLKHMRCVLNCKPVCTHLVFFKISTHIYCCLYLPCTALGMSPQGHGVQTNICYEVLRLWLCLFTNALLPTRVPLSWSLPLNSSNDCTVLSGAFTFMIMFPLACHVAHCCSGEHQRTMLCGYFSWLYNLAYLYFVTLLKYLVKKYKTS